MTTIDDVIGRMYNWKTHSAYVLALEVKDFPKEALKILKELADKFGNCGWCDGKIFDELRDKNNEVAKILGYVWSDKEDYWRKIQKESK